MGFDGMFHCASIIPYMPALFYLSVQCACLICRGNDYTSADKCDTSKELRKWLTRCLGFECCRERRVLQSVFQGTK